LRTFVKNVGFFVFPAKCRFLADMIGEDKRIYLLGGDEGVVEQFIHFLHYGWCSILEESDVTKKSKLFQLAGNCEVLELQEACFESMIEHLTIENAAMVACFTKTSFQDWESATLPTFRDGMEKLRQFFREWVQFEFISLLYLLKCAKNLFFRHLFQKFECHFSYS